MAEWVGEGCAVWAYFNNDADAQAIEDAERLRTLVERRGAG